MNRRNFISGLGSFVASLVSSAYAESRRSKVPPWGGWKEIPRIAVVSTDNDVRLPAVREAVDFWNHELSKLGSPFRLGTIEHIVGMIPLSDIYALRGALSGGILGRTDPIPLPDSVRRVRENVIVALSDAKFSDFSGFSTGWPAHRKALVVIRSNELYPFMLPGGARNVIAHEFGHVIGLGHNDDTTTLMCGGPAWCHFPYPNEGFFPLTKEEQTTLLEMYPPSWQDRPRKTDPPPGWVPG